MIAVNTIVTAHHKTYMTSSVEPKDRLGSVRIYTHSYDGIWDRIYVYMIVMELSFKRNSVKTLNRLYRYSVDRSSVCLMRVFGLSCAAPYTRFNVQFIVLDDILTISHT